MSAARIRAALLLSTLMPSAGLAQSTDPDSLVDLPSPPPGYYWGAPVALPDTLIEVRDGSRLRIEITRAGADEFESRLIELAERLHLEPDSVAAFFPVVPGSAEAGVEDRRSRLYGPDRWWWRSAGRVLVPFAVTGATVRYYLDEVRSGPALFAVFRDWPDPLTYSARVRPVDAGAEEAWEVELRLEVQVYCGDHCRLGLQHQRSVVFDSSGVPLRLEGDGPIRYRIATADPVPSTHLAPTAFPLKRP